MGLIDRRKTNDNNNTSQVFKTSSQELDSNPMMKVRFAASSDNYMFTRDYFHMHIWDVRKNKTPVQVFNTMDNIAENLEELAEKNRFVDRFDLSLSPCSTMCLTGSYNSQFHVIDMKQRVSTTIGAEYINQRRDFRPAAVGV